MSVTKGSRVRRFDGIAIGKLGFGGRSPRGLPRNGFTITTTTTVQVTAVLAGGMTGYPRYASMTLPTTEDVDERYLYPQNACNNDKKNKKKNNERTRRGPYTFGLG